MRLPYAIVLICIGWVTAKPVLAEPPIIEPRSISPFEAQIRAVEAGKSQGRITGGANVAPTGAYPWVVSLGVRNAPHTVGHFCGAVLIKDDWALTAAHCLTKFVMDGATIKQSVAEPQKVEVLTATNLLSAGGSAKAVDRIIVNPDFRTGKHNVLENDLALIHLKSASGQRSIPVITAQAATDFLGGPDSKVLIAGWGKVAFGEDQPLSNSLLNAFVSVLEKNKCNAPDIYDGLVEDTMICAGLGVIDACQGDSGGPAMAYIDGSPQLIGIVSWGVKCGDRRYPGVYVNVSKFSGWIANESK